MTIPGRWAWDARDPPWVLSKNLTFPLSGALAYNFCSTTQQMYHVDFNEVMACPTVWVSTTLVPLISKTISHVSSAAMQPASSAHHVQYPDHAWSGRWLARKGLMTTLSLGKGVDALLEHSSMSKMGQRSWVSTYAPVGGDTRS
jgi:hypothetical protein